MPRTNWDTKFCTCVISFVTHVTSDPVPNRSSCRKEKVMILRKQSFRIALPIFCPGRWTKTLLSEPQRPPNNTRPIICSPSVQIRFKLPAPPLCKPRMPSSTIRRIMLGWIRSISTSPTMNRPARMVKGKYRRIYRYISMPPFACHAANVRCAVNVRHNVFCHDICVRGARRGAHSSLKNGFPNLHGFFQEARAVFAYA